MLPEEEELPMARAKNQGRENEPFPRPAVSTLNNSNHYKMAVYMSFLSILTLLGFGSKTPSNPIAEGTTFYDLSIEGIDGAADVEVVEAIAVDVAGCQ